MREQRQRDVAIPTVPKLRILWASGHVLFACLKALLNAPAAANHFGKQAALLAFFWTMPSAYRAFLLLEPDAPSAVAAADRVGTL
jgi:hypothetical protein